jgi:hypothetical protein
MRLVFSLLICSALSVLALHPLYIHIPAMTKNEEILKIHSVARAQLNELSQIDYEVGFLPGFSSN